MTAGKPWPRKRSSVHFPIWGRAAMDEVAILLPGVMGSELFDGDECIWPGSIGELLLPYKKMASLLKPELKVGDIIRRVSVVDQYGSLVAALKKCGFDETGDKPRLL